MASVSVEISSVLEPSGTRRVNGMPLVPWSGDKHVSCGMPCAWAHLRCSMPSPWQWGRGYGWSCRGEGAEQIQGPGGTIHIISCRCGNPGSRGNILQSLDSFDMEKCGCKYVGSQGYRHSPPTDCNRNPGGFRCGVLATHPRNSELWTTSSNCMFSNSSILYFFLL